MVSPGVQGTGAGGHYVGPDVYQFRNFDTNPSFSYSKNTLDEEKKKQEEKK